MIVLLRKNYFPNSCVFTLVLGSSPHSELGLYQAHSGKCTFPRMLSFGQF